MLKQGCAITNCIICFTYIVSFPILKYEYLGPALLMPKKLITKNFKQKAWLWLADVLASANHSQAFCQKLFAKSLLILVTWVPGFYMRSRGSMNCWPSAEGNCQVLLKRMLIACVSIHLFWQVSTDHCISYKCKSICGKMEDIPYFRAEKHGINSTMLWKSKQKCSLWLHL